MPARSLALAIPTYNRAQAVVQTLTDLAPALRELRIPVHILDDSPNDDTKQALQALRQTAGLEILYIHNQPSLRHDRNLIATLLSPQADFVWLLGDGGLVDEQALRLVHAAVQDGGRTPQDGLDLVFLNCRDDAATPSRRLPAPALRPFLADNAWALTYTGATVYGRRVIEWWRRDPGTVVRNFPQLSVMLGFVAAHPDACAHWVGPRIVRAHPLRSSSYWLVDALSVWGKDWHDLITRHAGAFDAGVLPAVLRSHARHTGYLGGKHLVVMRSAGHLGPEVLRAAGPALSRCCTVPGWMLALIARLPQGMAQEIVRRRPSWKRRFLPTPET